VAQALHTHVSKCKNDKKKEKNKIKNQKEKNENHPSFTCYAISNTCGMGPINFS
jgi:hypothetical protein